MLRAQLHSKKHRQRRSKIIKLHDMLLQKHADVRIATALNRSLRYYSIPHLPYIYIHNT